MDCTIPGIQGNTTIVIHSSNDYFVMVVKIATLPVESVLQYIIKLFFSVHIYVFTFLTFCLSHVCANVLSFNLFLFPDNEPMLSLLALN